ncbi:cupin domain-containing protein [Bermanella marisrubri]|uniref:cupin domain-containing protein n=1 Tax=Bermanella marisrubri TaxID=207949 RepID=UPI001FB1A628|nr:cupin domain-containing protein [Bermanella marisrubri]
MIKRIETLDVGTRLKEVRKKSGLSQRELAKRAGVTNSTISMIEKNSVSPSVSSLKKVLGGIPLSLTEFFETEDTSQTATPVVYPAEEFLDSSVESVEFKLIGKDFHNRAMTFLVECLPPGAGTGAELYTHDGEEAGYVLSGKLELTVDEETYIVEAGQGYYFESSRPHRFHNPFDEECRLVSSTTPANF